MVWLIFYSDFQPLQIKSVVAKEGLKGYIYIEAYKQTHVKQAIEGIGNLRLGQWNQQVNLSSDRFHFHYIYDNQNGQIALVDV